MSFLNEYFSVLGQIPKSGFTGSQGSSILSVLRPFILIIIVVELDNIPNSRSRHEFLYTSLSTLIVLSIFDIGYSHWHKIRILIRIYIMVSDNEHFFIYGPLCHDLDFFKEVSVHFLSPFMMDFSLGGRVNLCECFVSQLSTFCQMC